MMQFLINNFDTDPNEPGSLVLDVRHDRWQMEVRYYGDRDGYYIYMFALNRHRKPAWTLLGDPVCETPAAARLLAREYRREIAGAEL
jgi:hypothetical protein